MVYDVVVVLYNSARWLPGCVAALAKASLPSTQLNLIFVDNASTDDTRDVVKNLQLEYTRFASFTLFSMQKNVGFAAGCNMGAKRCSAPLLMFLNADTEVEPAVFVELDKAIENAVAQTVAFECRQIPYEHPKYYNPVTLETSWSSAAALVVKRAAFEQVAGFDEDFFMYCEDVDLSWRLRLQGGRLQYVPTAVVAHYAYCVPGEQKPRQVVGHLAGDLALRHKFGTKDEVAAWQTFYESTLPQLQQLPEAQALLQRELLQSKKLRGKRRAFWRSNVRHSSIGFAPVFLNGDYAFMRPGAYEEVQPTVEGPLFSIVVRTHKRPQLLLQTLQSLAHQTYKNFEVVVVEDGEPTAGSFLREGYLGLNLLYFATGSPVGRCSAGNLALQKAKGEYINFLDDDDYFFADHLEKMAQLIAQNPKEKLFATGSLEALCHYRDGDVCNWEIADMKTLSHSRVTFAQEAFSNCFPIQAIAFHRSLFERWGGFDKGLDAFEDWDMWVRYMQQSTMVCCPKGTSMYKTPADPLVAAQRFLHVHGYTAAIQAKFATYKASVSAAQISAIAQQEAGEEHFALCQQAEDWQRAAMGVYNSTSWRITKPLRAIRRVFLPRAFRQNKELANNILFCNPAQFTLLGDYRKFTVLARASMSWRMTAPLRLRLK